MCDPTAENPSSVSGVSDRKFVVDFSRGVKRLGMGVGCEDDVVDTGCRHGGGSGGMVGVDAPI